MQSIDVGPKPDRQDWFHARIEWLGHLDAEETAPALRPGARHLATFPSNESDPTEADCHAVDDQIWIWQPGVGAVRFSLNAPCLYAYPWPGGDEEHFRFTVTHTWLPSILPLWKRQVLHASAVACPSSGLAVAFTGPTHAGKSTTAYGLAREGRWLPISDDTIGFTVSNGVVDLYPLPNAPRLRSATARHYGVSSADAEPLAWPDTAVRLGAVYALDPLDPDSDAPVAEFVRLRPADAVRVLLEQAFTLSFELPKYNQQLMTDYVALATATPVFRLSYRRSFDVVDELFRAIQAHLAREAGLSCDTSEHRHPV